MSWVESSTRMVLRTIRLATRVPIAAASDTLLAPFNADEVGKCLRVLGAIWLKSICANARVGQGSLQEVRQSSRTKLKLYSRDHKYLTLSIAIHLRSACREGDKMLSENHTTSLKSVRSFQWFLSFAGAYGEWGDPLS